MDKRDSELDYLLKPLRGPKAQGLQNKRWQKAVSEELQKGRIPYKEPKIYIPMTAALFIGFLLGGITIFALNHFKSDDVSVSEKSLSSATIEYVFAKSE